jgi:hypothetical protein
VLDLWLVFVGLILAFIIGRWYESFQWEDLTNQIKQKKLYDLLLSDKLTPEEVSFIMLAKVHKEPNSKYL